MAKSNAVWGIEVGQCALKALRCRPHEKDGNRIIVEAFDYIEYPKILTQPEANREELVREALEQFVSRNTLTGDRVAVSVPGQSGLARFIKLPPGPSAAKSTSSSSRRWRFTTSSASTSWGISKACSGTTRRRRKWCFRWARIRRTLGSLTASRFGNGASR